MRASPPATPPGRLLAVAGARGPTSWEREAIRLLVDDGLDVSILPGPGAPDADSVDAPPERPDAVLVLGGDGGSRCSYNFV